MKREEAQERQREERTGISELGLRRLPANLSEELRGAVRFSIEVSHGHTGYVLIARHGFHAVAHASYENGLLRTAISQLPGGETYPGCSRLRQKLWLMHPWERVGRGLPKNRARAKCPLCSAQTHACGMPRRMDIKRKQIKMLTRQQGLTTRGARIQFSSASATDGRKDTLRRFPLYWMVTSATYRRVKFRFCLAFHFFVLFR